MEYRNLGNSGLRVTNLCLGTMTFANQADKTTAFQILDKAVDGGINFIDTADVYPLGGGLDLTGQTESIIGDWIVGKRDRVVLASKCFGKMGPLPTDEGLSRRHILSAVEASLRRLKTDYLDLYQAHQFDSTTPIEETLRAFEDLVHSGKVRYIGVSNWRAWQVMKALGIADKQGFARIVSVQPRYNLLFRMIEEELMPLCRAEGVGLITYNPLAGGMLTGRYKPGQDVEAGTRFGLNYAGAMYQQRYWQEATFRVMEEYRKWCEENNLNMATTAVRWVIQQPGITSAIIGASRPDQLDASLSAAEAPALSEDELAFLDRLWFSLPRRREDR